MYVRFCLYIIIITLSISYRTVDSKLFPVWAMAGVGKARVTGDAGKCRNVGYSALLQ